MPHPIDPDLCGAPPQLATTDNWAAGSAWNTTRSSYYHARKSKGLGMNLKAVAQALIDEGYDPAVELIKIVQSRELPAEIQARFLNELIGYYQPKVKAVEISGPGKGPIEIAFTPEQARAIAEEYLVATAEERDAGEAV